MKQLSTASHGWRSTKMILASGKRRWTSGIRAMCSGCLSTTIWPGAGGDSVVEHLEIARAHSASTSAALHRPGSVSPAIDASTSRSTGNSSSTCKPGMFISNVSSRVVPERGKPTMKTGAGGAGGLGLGPASRPRPAPA